MATRSVELLGTPERNGADVRVTAAEAGLLELRRVEQPAAELPRTDNGRRAARRKRPLSVQDSVDPLDEITASVAPMPPSAVGELIATLASTPRACDDRTRLPGEAAGFRRAAHTSIGLFPVAAADTTTCPVLEMCGGGVTLDSPSFADVRRDAAFAGDDRAAEVGARICDSVTGRGDESRATATR